jgi:hypothetical protein
LTVHKEEERICRELGDESGLQVLLGNQAQALFLLGDLKDALLFERRRSDLP